MSTPLEKLILSLLLITRLRQGFGEQALVMAGVFGAACLRRQGQGVFAHTAR